MSAISLYLVKYTKHVTGVEIVDSAVLNIRDNAVQNNLDNAEFIMVNAGRMWMNI